MNFSNTSLKFKITILLILLTIGLLFLPTFSESFELENIDSSIFVSKNGSNSSLGSLKRPFRTIQYALDNVRAGQTIYILEGTYYEKLEIINSGSRNGGYITIRSYEDDKVILDGSKSSGDDMIEISNKSYIIIKDLIIKNNVNRYSTGVQIKSGSRHIEINGLDISNISTNVAPNSGDNGGANVIISISKTEADPNYDIRILNNHIYDCDLGKSEAITMTQNTVNFQISNNKIHDVTNIGIDIAGHYGSFDGDESFNQARDGLISDNIIYNARSLYGSGAASGLYVDGARDLIIERNIVYANDYGLTIGCENPKKSASNIVVKNNIIHNNDKSGISIGGYKASVGIVENSYLYNNLSYSNNNLQRGSHAELSINKTSGNIEIYNNIFYQSRTTDKENPIIRNLFDNDKLDINYNLYYSENGMSNTAFGTDDDEIIGFNNYRFQSGNDSNSVFANPLLNLKDQVTLSFDKKSPAIDLGNPYHQYKGDIDINKNTRSINDLFDAGPVEIGSKIINYVFDGELGEWNIKNQSNKINISSDDLMLYIAVNNENIGLKQQFYFDVDDNKNSGFSNKIIPEIGADYLIENGNLYAYSGKGSNWSWKKIEILKYTSKDTIIETSVYLSSIGLEEGKNIKIGFITSKDFETRDELIFLSENYKVKSSTY